MLQNRVVRVFVCVLVCLFVCLFVCLSVLFCLRPDNLVMTTHSHMAYTLWVSCLLCDTHTHTQSMPHEIVAMQESLGNSVYTVAESNVRGKDVAVFGMGPTGLNSVACAIAMGARKVIAVAGSKEHIALASKVLCTATRCLAVLVAVVCRVATASPDPHVTRLLLPPCRWAPMLLSIDTQKTLSSASMYVGPVRSLRARACQPGNQPHLLCGGAGRNRRSWCARVS